jgi:hypothetical protein
MNIHIVHFSEKVHPDGRHVSNDLTINSYVVSIKQIVRRFFACNLSRRCGRCSGQPY